MPSRNDNAMPGAAFERRLSEAARRGRADAAAGVPAARRNKLLAAVTEVAGPSPPGERSRIYQEYMRVHGRVEAREELVDAGSEMSFPASDPPSYMGGASTAGGPSREDADVPAEKANTRVSDPSEVRPARDDMLNPGSSNRPEDATKRRR